MTIPREIFAMFSNINVLLGSMQSHNQKVLAMDYSKQKLYNVSKISNLAKGMF